MTPNWYFDPRDRSILRWWDGTNWTEHVKPAPVSAPMVYQNRTVTKVPVQTSHVVHLILTLLTCGLWAPVWIIMAVLNKSQKRRVVSYHQ